ncbi:response regulator transcription factor, partial [Streptomyces sp. NPDC055722]
LPAGTDIQSPPSVVRALQHHKPVHARAHSHTHSCTSETEQLPTPPAEILDAVRRVAAGDPVLSPAVTRQLMAHAAGAGPGTRRHAARERIAALGEREREVAVAVGRGASNAEIAAELYMSVATVKTHVSWLLAKLGLNNRVQIALLTYDAGLLDEPGH